MAEIDAKTLEKIGKLIPRLASNHAGEVSATAAAIMRTLKASGASLHDVVALLQRKPVERVVYRDRIVERVVEVEKVVYRDPPAPPRDDEPMTAAHAAEAAELLMLVPELTENQRSFVEVVARTAERGEATFRLSPKQWVWLRDLIGRHLPAS